jgi:diguanylate cyclase (GGDEF)-like protein
MPIAFAEGSDGPREIPGNNPWRRDTHLLTMDPDNENPHANQWGRVLVADDDSMFRKLLESWLRQWNFTVEVAADGAEAWQQMQLPGAPRLLVLDWMMPGMDGIELCRRIRSLDLAPNPYIILLTSNDTKEQIVHGLNSGADDYLTKPANVNEFHARLQVGARTLALQEALSRKEQDLRFAATHDQLTGLWNRRAILEFLQREVAQHQRSDVSLSLLMIDVDRFKTINDDFGHLVGDAVLREISLRLEHCCRQNDWLGRYGGEEFMVIASCGPEGLPQLCERLRSSIDDVHIATSAGDIHATISIGGLSVPPAVHATCDALIHLADTALYCAKNSGRNRVELVGLSENHAPHERGQATAPSNPAPDLGPHALMPPPAGTCGIGKPPC